MELQWWKYAALVPRSKYSRAHSGDDDDDEEVGKEGALGKDASLGSPPGSSSPKEFTFVGSGFAQCVTQPPCASTAHAHFLPPPPAAATHTLQDDMIFGCLVQVPHAESESAARVQNLFESYVSPHNACMFSRLLLTQSPTFRGLHVD